MSFCQVLKRCTHCKIALGSFFRPHGVFCVEWNVELKLATGRCALGAVCRCCARRSALARWSWSCAWRPHWQISYFAPQPLRCYSPVSLLARSRGGRCRVRGGRLRHAPGVLRLPRPAGDHREVFSTSMPIQPCSPRDGIVTSAGWQVTPCDLLRHVSCRSDEARRKLL